MSRLVFHSKKQTKSWNPSQDCVPFRWQKLLSNLHHTVIFRPDMAFLIYFLPFSVFSSLETDLWGCKSPVKCSILSRDHYIFQERHLNCWQHLALNFRSQTSETFVTNISWDNNVWPVTLQTNVFEFLFVSFTI